jgi:Asp-tRNA(Asn)/Glu-tRNA(Gln) amidotransferase A subunit family amidase
MVAACLARIDEREPEVGAWAFVDPDLAMGEARRADERRRSGRPVGPLNGVPIGIKDVIDTADMPTENGTPLDAGRRPRTDAAVVGRLRAAGAVILGKTVTTELAFMHPAGTRNPHDPARTPGGSSSGSAAAVASLMVPAALGTQTNGSMIRPASFCGVVGYKPSFGLVPRTGIHPLSPHLDTVGVFARSVEDAALVADAIAGFDEADRSTRPGAPPRLHDLASSPPPVRPAIAFVKSPAWEAADAATREGFAELVAALGDCCEEVPLPETFAEAVPAQRALMLAGVARNNRLYAERGAEALSASMRELMAEGRKVTAVDYLAALDWREVLNTGLEAIFDRFDAIVTPAAPGEAPVGVESTGNPVFCTLWQLCGVPAVSLPLLEGPNGMPVGVQLVGRRNHDGRLLRTARWLIDSLAAEPKERSGS